MSLAGCMHGIWQVLTAQSAVAAGTETVLNVTLRDIGDGIFDTLVFLEVTFYLLLPRTTIHNVDHGIFDALVCRGVVMCLLCAWLHGMVLILAAMPYSPALTLLRFAFTVHAIR